MEKFTQIKKINENEVPQGANQWLPNIKSDANFRNFIDGQKNGTEPIVTKSEPSKFVSKIFESRQMAHVYHLQAKGDGAFALHMALDSYYNGILELNDELIEVYQGQYDIIENYENIEGKPNAENAIQYFTELSQFVKDTRKIAFLAEDTHLQNIVDEMSSLIYKTLYKLKNLK